MNIRKKSSSFEDLVMWQRSHTFTLGIYKFTGQFPKSEQFGLTSQLRRSAVSIPANIAEGFKKRGLKDKLRYLNIAQGSLEESRYYLILAKDLGYGEDLKLESLATEIGKLLEAYSQAIRNST